MIIYLRKCIQISASADQKECFPIRIPDDDPFWKQKNVTCMEFTRSLSVVDIDCSADSFKQQVYI